jgi:hypothetical protein
MILTSGHGYSAVRSLSDGESISAVTCTPVTWFVGSAKLLVADLSFLRPEEFGGSGGVHDVTLVASLRLI